MVVKIRTADEVRLAAREAAALAAFPDFGRSPRRKERPSLEERFWSRTRREGDHLLWTGARTVQGYGQVRRKGTTVLAHRQAWEYGHGPIPPGLYVVHTCPWALCLAHLALGTAKHRGLTKRTTCPRGHPYSHVRPDGARACRQCQVESNRRYRQRRKQKEHHMDPWAYDLDDGFKCWDCRRSLDDLDAGPTTLVPEGGELRPVCGRCLRQRRLRLAAADACETSMVEGTYGSGSSVPPEAA